MDKVIGARETGTGEESWHASVSLPGNYHTLCGLSLDDDEFDPISSSATQKVTCEHCLCVWKEAKKFKASDFRKESDK